MYIKELKIKNFRSYENEKISFSEGTNIIYGGNAQGKTNILEAILVFCSGRSHRRATDADMITYGKDFSIIEIEFCDEKRVYKGKMKISPNAKKSVTINEAPLTKISQISNYINAVMFSPEDLSIIKEGPGERRRFIDMAISQIKPNYYENLRRYNEVLKQKNAVLKGPDPLRDETMLDVFDRQLCKYGTEVMKYRERFVKMLSDKSSEIQNKISCGKESLEIEYKNSAGIETFGEELSKNRKNDIYSRSSGIGPQRDDLVFFINGKDARKYGSQGQQRTIALSLKLAEIQIVRKLIDEDPILLLDDVLSELDAERQKFLLNEIENVQLFVTATEINGELLKKTDKGKIFTVNNGNVTEENR